MFGGRAIYRLLSEKLQSQATIKASPVLSSLISKKEQEEIGSTATTYLRAVALFGAGVSGLLSFSTLSSCDKAEHRLEPPNYPWPHKGILSSSDHAS